MASTELEKDPEAGQEDEKIKTLKTTGKSFKAGLKTKEKINFGILAGFLVQQGKY